MDGTTPGAGSARVTLSILLVAVVLGACDESGGGSGADARASESGDSDSVASSPGHSGETGEATSRSSASEGATAPVAEAIGAFHEMDGRRPLPLTPMMANHQRQNMRDHLVAVREIVGAAAERDFDGVEEAAEKIGSSPEMRRMCNHMGAGAEGFTERALEFHETADGIVEAAGEEDLEGTMEALDATLQTCTSCHAEYKQKVVPEEVWAEKTGMGAPTGEMRRKHGGGH